MEEFTEEHVKLLLNREWLAKVDSTKATPYLVKYYASTADLSCCIMVTDTKSVWTEVLNGKQMARRWRDCNAVSPGPLKKNDDEDLWREETLELLSKTHTIGGIADFTLEIVKSNYCDLALELECESFKWRWETCFSGYRRSSEIISKHLIFPLISVNHLIFSSPKAVDEMPDVEIEKAVDKVGRTARRALYTHIKNALSKPRVATTLRRMTAVFNFSPDLPSISSTAEKPDLRVEQIAMQQTAEDPPPKEHIKIKLDVAPKYSSERPTPERNHSVKVKPIEPDSATESDTNEPANRKKGTSLLSPAGPSKREENKKDTLNTPVPVPSSSGFESSFHRPTKRPKPEIPSTSEEESKAAKVKDKPSSGSDSSFHRPTKIPKPEIPSTSEEDSDADCMPRIAGTSTGGTRRSTAPRQPIKRGGKRF